MNPDALSTVGAGVVSDAWTYVTLAYAVALVGMAAYAALLIVRSPPSEEDR
jgi:hypothetical protein